MNPIREAELIETRRHFFGRAAAGLVSGEGASDSPWAVQMPVTAGTRCICQFNRQRFGCTTLRTESKTRDLPVHVRSALAVGYVGLQTEDARVVRQGLARFGT